MISVKSPSPAVPVAVVMMVAVMVPAMMAMIMVPPMHFRRRQPGIFLNRRGSAGIAERQCIRRRSEREQRTNGGQTQNFRELHEISPSVLRWREWLGATLHAIWRARLECALNERATKMNASRRFRRDRRTRDEARTAVTAIAWATR